MEGRPARRRSSGQVARVTGVPGFCEGFLPIWFDARPSSPCSFVPKARSAWSFSGSIMTAVESNRLTTTPAATRSSSARGERRPGAEPTLVLRRSASIVARGRLSADRRRPPSSASSSSRSSSKASPPTRRGRGSSTCRSTEIFESPEHEHPVGQQNGLLDVVGDQEYAGVVAAAQLGHEALHAEAGQGVEGGERLVEEQELGLAHQRPGQRDPLGLSAREGAGPGVGMVLQAHLAQRADGALARRFACGAVRARRCARPALRPRGAALGRRPCGPPGREPRRRLATSSPARMRSRVVFPLPEAPRSATNSPWATVRSRSARTSRSPNLLVTSTTTAAGWVVGRFIGPPDDGATAWCSAPVCVRRCRR